LRVEESRGRLWPVTRDGGRGTGDVGPEVPVSGGSVTLAVRRRLKLAGSRERLWPATEARARGTWNPWSMSLAAPSHSWQVGGRGLKVEGCGLKAGR
jgi:hypothetical protein